MPDRPSVADALLCRARLGAIHAYAASHSDRIATACSRSPNAAPLASPS
jgi:hypothetical protein